MKINKKILIGTLLMVFVLACASSTAFAATYNITNTTSAQTVIGNTNTNNTVLSFDPDGNYSSFSVVVPQSVQNLTLNGNGAKLYGTGNSPVFDINFTTGLTLNNFTIDIGGNGQTGIRGATVTGLKIANSTIKNGGDGISLFMVSQGNTIVGNTIYNMSNTSGGFGNGISLVNHDNSTTNGSNTGGSALPSYIGSNNISDVVFGIFIGGNFQGNITANDIFGASDTGIQFAGRRDPTNGIVSVDLIGNSIISSNIGLALDTPTFQYLNITSNYIRGTTSCVEMNANNTNQSFDNLIVANNLFWGGFGDLGKFYNATGPFNWIDNFFNGEDFPP